MVHADSMRKTHGWEDTVNLAWLEVFREVALRGSLTAAGQALGYTQSAVSRQVSALEKATGAHLFDRLPRGVQLTEEGRCLLAHAEAVLERMRAAQQALEALRDLDAGRLRVGAFDSADAALVPRALAAFRMGRSTLPWSAPTRTRRWTPGNSTFITCWMTR